MAERERLLRLLEHFVLGAVQIEDLGDGAEMLGRKLDTLERVVELLRLRTGRVENRLSMRGLLASSIEVKLGEAGAVLRVGGSVRHQKPSTDFAEERGQVELQVPLMLYLLQTHGRVRRINDLITDFVESLKDELSPADVETTRTGVTRVVTTTRSTARALRIHGLLTRSERSSYKSWELSVLGLLVAAILQEQGTDTKLRARCLRTQDGGPFGMSNALAEPVAHVLGDLAAPDVVGARLRAIFGPNQDVLDSFEQAGMLIAQFCARLQREDQVGHTDWHARRWATKAFLGELGTVLTPSQLGDDLLKNQALKGLLGP